jgi:hypothetical protein
MLNQTQKSLQELERSKAEMQGRLERAQSDCDGLKLQNIYLSRWCLYQHRPTAFKVKQS